MKYSLLIAALGLAATSASATLLSQFNFNEIAANRLTDAASGAVLDVNSIRTPIVTPDGLIFDGYSTTVAGELPAIFRSAPSEMTFSIILAPETYPMMTFDRPASEAGLIAGNIDSASKTGFELRLGREGEVTFNSFSNNWPVTVKSDRTLPRGKYTRVTAVFDGNEKKVRLYFGSELVGEAKSMATLAMPLAPSQIRFGGDDEGVLEGMWRLDTFNGLIAEAEIHDKMIDPATLDAPSGHADLSVPAEIFADEPLRPRFHAMPSADWMNESHGLTYSGGKYHLFFQKNGNGPYMSRLHWGHVESDDLCTWKEAPIAFGPDTDYDVKGCWSGCVFTDDKLTGGLPRAYYTAVDYGRARIVHADPTDASLKEWSKPADAIDLDGRPDGLSDDFRDCYVFRNGQDYFMIVGTSKDNLGAATLHKLDPATGRWSNDGKIFFQAGSQTSGGRFWEMPSLTQFGDKWLFCATPLEMGQGVQAIYWVGTLNSDGTFNPITPLLQPGKVELDGTSREGFGLLSPSILQRDGKTIAMGIVPDKLAGDHNLRLGWAHNISLPREWSLSEDNKLIQRPYSGLEALRAGNGFSKADFTQNGVLSLDAAKGRAFEAIAVFEKGTTPVGFRFFKSANGAAELIYNPADNRVTLDFSSMPRLDNDSWLFNGGYSAAIPESLPAGSEIKLQVIVDHSIAEVFVNDKWAFAVRLFPTDADADGVEMFADGDTKVKSLRAWPLAADSSSVEEIGATAGAGNSVEVVASGRNLRVSGLSGDSIVSLYSPDGMQLASVAANGRNVVEMEAPSVGLHILTVATPGQPLVASRHLLR